MKQESNNPEKGEGLIVPADWNQTDHAWPSDLCVHQLFEKQVFQTPDALALEQDGVTLTYRQLNERANQLAHCLAGLGVRPNSLVGILLNRSIDVIVAIYATLKSGAAYVPLDPAYPAERLNYMVNTANVAVLITHTQLGGVINHTPELIVFRLDQEQKALQDAPTTNLQTTVTPDNLIYIIFTSGSTGRPKGAAVYHRGFTNLLHWFTTEFAIDKSDRVLLVSSLSFDLTQKNLYATLICGGSLHIYPSGPYDVSLMVNLISLHKVTLLNCTPSAFYPLVESLTEVAFQQLASLRTVFLGGESISIARLSPWLTHPICHAEIANTYGPTECTDICGAYRMNRANMGAYSFVPLGRPIYNVQLAIVDPRLQLCPIGVAGELLVGGAGVGAGYINDPELTAKKFIPNRIAGFDGSTLYRTGDQARWMPDGVIEFLGRLDHQVKIRGFRIELHEIEAALNTYPDIRESIVVVKESATGGDPRLVGFFTSKSGGLINADTLKSFVSSTLPEYMVPSSLNHLPVFPLSPNGKVDRGALRDIPESVVELKTLATANDTEYKIRQIWLEVLGRSDADLDGNFFDLGGDSIQLARVHVILQKNLNREFPITELFTYTTIRTLAAHFSSLPGAVGKKTGIQDRARLQREAAVNRRPSHR